MYIHTFSDLLFCLDMKKNNAISSKQKHRYLLSKKSPTLFSSLYKWCHLEMSSEDFYGFTVFEIRGCFWSGARSMLTAAHHLSSEKQCKVGSLYQSPRLGHRVGRRCFSVQECKQILSTGQITAIRMAPAVGLLKDHNKEGDNYRSKLPEDVNDIAF